MEKSQQDIETTSTLADLPQDILLLILEKMHDLNLVDLIQFGAVCKNWNMIITKNKLIKFQDYDDTLPWLCTLSWANDHSQRLECELFDPNSRKIFKTWKSVEKRNCSDNYPHDIIRDYGSKQGWFITGSAFKQGSIFMYNAYSKEIIPLPCMKHNPCSATFSGNPVSKDCQVFAICRDRRDCLCYIARYSLNGGKKWKIKFLEETKYECIGLQYMKGQLFCLFENGMLKRYCLADESWTTGHSFVGFNCKRFYLINFKEDLILVACRKYSMLCWTFYFDWSSMSWVEYDSAECKRIYISRNTATLFVDNDGNGKKTKVYLFPGSRKEETPDYSFLEMRKSLQKKVYENITVFMDPPRIH